MFSEQRGRSRKGVLVVVVVSVVVSDSVAGGGVVKIGNRFWVSGGIGDPRTGTLNDNDKGAIITHLNRPKGLRSFTKVTAFIQIQNLYKTSASHLHIFKSQGHINQVSTTSELVS